MLCKKYVVAIIVNLYIFLLLLPKIQLFSLKEKSKQKYFSVKRGGKRKLLCFFATFCTFTCKKTGGNVEFIGFAPTLLVNLSSMFYAPNNVNNGKISQRLACFKNKNIVSKFVFVGNTFSVPASTSYSLKLQVG